MKNKLMICIAVLAVTASQNCWSSAIYKRLTRKTPTADATPGNDAHNNNAPVPLFRNAIGEQFEKNLAQLELLYPAAAARIDNDPAVKNIFEMLSRNLRPQDREGLEARLKKIG